MRAILLLLNVRPIGASIVTRLKVFSIFLLKSSIFSRTRAAAPMIPIILPCRVTPVTCSSRISQLVTTKKVEPRSPCFIHVATHGTCILLSMLNAGKFSVARQLAEQP